MYIHKPRNDKPPKKWTIMDLLSDLYAVSEQPVLSSPGTSSAERPVVRARSINCGERKKWELTDSSRPKAPVNTKKVEAESAVNCAFSALQQLPAGRRRKRRRLNAEWKKASSRLLVLWVLQNINKLAQSCGEDGGTNTREPGGV